MYLLLSYVTPLESPLFNFIQFYFHLSVSGYLCMCIYLHMCSAVLGKPYQSTVISNNNNNNSFEDLLVIIRGRARSAIT